MGLPAGKDADLSSGIGVDFATMHSVTKPTRSLPRAGGVVQAVPRIKETRDMASRRLANGIDSESELQKEADSLGALTPSGSSSTYRDIASVARKRANAARVRRRTTTAIDDAIHGYTSTRVFLSVDKLKPNRLRRGMCASILLISRAYLPTFRKYEGNVASCPRARRQRDEARRWPL